MTSTPKPAGFIHALLLDGNGGGRMLDWEETQNWAPGDGCLWMHFMYTDEESQRWIRQHSGLNDVACDGLLTMETRPRVLSRGDNLLAAFRGVNLNAGSDPEDMVSVRLWCDGNRIISTRLRALKSTEDLLQRIRDGQGPVNAASLIENWLARIVGRMSDTIDDFEDRVAEMEEDVLSGSLEGMRARLAQLRKQTITMRRWLAPQREAINRLYTEPLSWIGEMDRLRLREVADKQIRHIEDIDEVRERATMVQEELMGRLSEQMNERTYVFTVVATIFLPLGFFTGLMGINVGGMPGVEGETAFWIVVGICVGVTALLALYFRAKRWL